MGRRRRYKVVGRRNKKQTVDVNAQRKEIEDVNEPFEAIIPTTIYPGALPFAELVADLQKTISHSESEAFVGSETNAQNTASHSGGQPFVQLDATPQKTSSHSGGHPFVDLEATSQKMTSYSSGHISPTETSTPLLSPSDSSSSESQDRKEPEVAPIRRKHRGPTLTNSILDLQDGAKMIVQVGASGIPVGAEASKLANFIGILARRPDLAPLGFRDWRLMEPQYKKAMWEAIEAKIEFLPQCSAATRIWAMRSAATKWRMWKNEIKHKYFNKRQTPQQMWGKVTDARVDKSQFFALVDIWLSESHQKRCETNRQVRIGFGEPQCIRTKCETNMQVQIGLDDPHCSRTKSFTMLIHGKTQAEGMNQVTPSSVGTYITNHKQNRGALNDKAKEHMDLMEMYRNETHNTSSSHGVELKWQGGIYSEVKVSERNGINRCFDEAGPSKGFASAASTEQNIQQTLNGVIDILVRLTQIWKEQLPNANIGDVMEAAKRLASQAMAVQAEVPVPYARSVLNDPQVENLPSVEDFWKENGLRNTVIYRDGAESSSKPQRKQTPESSANHWKKPQQKQPLESPASHWKLNDDCIQYRDDAEFSRKWEHKQPLVSPANHWKPNDDCTTSRLPFPVPLDVNTPFIQSFSVDHVETLPSDPMIMEAMNNSKSRTAEVSKEKRKQTAGGPTSLVLRFTRNPSKKLKVNTETAEINSVDNNLSKHKRGDINVSDTDSGQDLNDSCANDYAFHSEVNIPKETTTDISIQQYLNETCVNDDMLHSVADIAKDAAMFSQCVGNPRNEFQADVTITKHEKDIIQAFLRDATDKLNVHFYSPLGNFCLGKHIHNLLYGGMVEDKIIDIFMDVLHCKHSKNSEDPPFFFASLKVTQLVKIKVKRGTNINLVNLFKCHRRSFEHLKKVFCVMLTSNHRHLLVADFQKKKFQVYDSIHGNKRHKREAERWKQWISDFYMDNYTKDNLYDWELEFVKDCPQQASNSMDCGVYIMKFMEYLCEDREPNFTQEDIPRFRKEIAAVLLNCGGKI